MILLQCGALHLITLSEIWGPPLYNKYNIGDKVYHRGYGLIEFEIIDILATEPEKPGEYLYCCKVTKDSGKKQIPQGWETAEEIAENINNPNRPLSERIFKYKEGSLIKRPTIQEAALEVEKRLTKFLELIVKEIVREPEHVKVVAKVDELGILLRLKVDREDIGMIMGRRGATAKAIRTLLRVIGAKHDLRVNLLIEE